MISSQVSILRERIFIKNSLTVHRSVIILKTRSVYLCRMIGRPLQNLLFKQGYGLIITMNMAILLYQEYRFCIRSAHILRQDWAADLVIKFQLYSAMILMKGTIRTFYRFKM